MGGDAACVCGSEIWAQLGKHQRKSSAKSSSSTRVRTWSKRWGPGGLGRICSFFTIRLLTYLVDGRLHERAGDGLTGAEELAGSWGLTGRSQWM